jgi:probable rRNA maturation factor
VKAVKNRSGISVEVVKLHPGVPLSFIGLKRKILFVLKQEKISNAQLTCVLASDHFLRRLNKKFTTRDMPTDVLSFDLSCDIKNGALFGDIVVSVDSAARVSKSLRLPFKEELMRYLIHGILHLTGYDDTTAFKKKKMWKRQEELLKEV